MRRTGYTYPNRLDPGVWIQLVMLPGGLEPTILDPSCPIGIAGNHAGKLDPLRRLVLTKEERYGYNKSVYHGSVFY